MQQRDPAPLRPSVPERIRQAWDLVAEGRIDAADAVFSDILAEQPAHQAAFMGRVHLARARQEHDTALAMLDERLDQARATGAAFPARMALNYLEVCIICARPDRVPEAVDRLALDAAAFNDRELVRLSVAAERLGLTDVVIRVIDLMSHMESLSVPAGLRLMQMAVATGQADVARGVQAALLKKVDAADYQALWVEFERQAHGPRAALQAARDATRPVRDAAVAAVLAQALLDAAEPRLARRYLRFCRRRWPDSDMIRKLSVTGCIATGEPEAARAEIASWGADTPPPLVAEAGIELATAVGDLVGIETALDTLQGRRAIPQLRLQVCFAKGDLEGAEDLVPAVSATMGRGRRVVAHFGTTHVGAVLNELRLWRRFETDRESGARAYFFAAKDILDDQQARLAALDRWPRGPIPRQVFQYWDKPEVPPAIGQIMHSWQCCAGVRYRRLDKRAAVAFLKTRFDGDHVRAFRLANHASEEADFLRICLLLAEGGIYADADDRLTGPIGALLEHGRGMLVFRERFGAVANNVICARAGHPVLKIARDLAMASLLARENDGPWSKTGPGLLTRAVAVYLTGVSDADLRDDFLIRPEIEMRRTVYPHVKLPYKSTPQYWDTRFGSTGKAVTDALVRAFAPAEPVTSPANGPDQINRKSPVKSDASI